MIKSRQREIEAAAKAAGVQIREIEQTRKHIKIKLANGGLVVTGLTPSDKRANLNLIRDLRSVGRE